MSQPDIGARLPEGVGRGVRRTTTAAVALVALVAAAVSYAHMRDLAEQAGEQWRAWLVPLAVDGLLVAAAMSMLVSRRRGDTPSALAWFSLVLGIAASLAANVAAAAPTVSGRLVAAWPPVALALAFELLMQQTLHPARRAARTEPDTRADAPAERATDSAPPTPSDPAPVEGAQARPQAPRRARSADGTRAPKARGARGAGVQERARTLFDRAQAEGRADALTGAALAREVGAHPGTARKWLAVWRAETTTDSGADAETPRLAVVGGGGQQ